MSTTEPTQKNKIVWSINHTYIANVQVAANSKAEAREIAANVVPNTSSYKTGSKAIGKVLNWSMDYIDTEVVEAFPLEE